MAGSASAPDPAPEPSPSLTLTRLKIRRDFLSAAKARKWTTPGFVLQARKRREDEPAAQDIVRIGYTASKKVGNAVARNRAKRRLRALAEPRLAALGRAGWDYVLIARADETAARPFTQLQSDLAEAVLRVHESGGKRRPAKRRP